MKEHAKNAIKHDINVLGKSVPVIAIAALFLIGSGSAALLTNFGTVSGDATVDQAVTFADEENPVEKTFDFDEDSFVAPATFSERITIENSANQSVAYNWDFSESVSLGADDSRVSETDYSTSFVADNEKDVSVDVSSDLDTVTYEIGLPVEMSIENEEPENMDAEFDVEGDGQTDFHIKYQRAEDSSEFTEGMSEFGVAVYEDGSYERYATVEEVADIESVELQNRDGEAGETVEIVLAKPAQTQSFGMRVDYERDGATFPEGFSYATTSTYEELDVADGVTTGVYEVSEFDLQAFDYGPSDYSDSGYDVEVTPSQDTVSYTVDTPENTTQVNLVVSTPEDTNYQLMYNVEADEFDVKNPATASGSQDSEEFDRFVSGEGDSDSVTFVVSRSEFYEQTFTAHLLGDFREFDSATTVNAIEADLEDKNGIEGDKIYSDSSMESHQAPSMQNLVNGEAEDISADSSSDFNVVADFNAATAGGDYTVSTSVVPVVE